MILIPIFAAVLFILIFLYYDKKYRKTSYYKITKQSYLSVLNNSGRYGEYLAFKKLEKLENSGAKFLCNVYIPKANGETTEIDMLMISSKGIFVFEIKNYSGWIFGNENQKNWYQTLPAGKGKSHKEVFYNPIMQNESHVNHLYKFIKGSSSIYSVVVFSDKCTFKDIQISGSNSGLVYLSQLDEFVSNILNQSNDVVLDENRIISIYDALYPCSQTSMEQKAQHIQNVQASKKPHNKEISNNFQNLQCPQCGGSLVLRTSKKGANAGNQFYGCSNYPKCKYIRNIKYY
jgi:hypothetical protein